MNKEQTEGKLKELNGKFKETWAKLTDNDLLLYKSQRDQFVGKVMQIDGSVKKAAEKKIKAIEDACCCGTKAA